MLHKLYILIILSILALSCDTDDDGFYNETYVDAQNNLVTIQHVTAAMASDTVKISVVIPNFLMERNFANPLDIRRSTGNAERFNMTIIVEKKATSGDWHYVDLTNQFITDEGSAVGGAFAIASIPYDATQQEYRFRGKMVLSEAGEYRVGFGVTSSATKNIILRSESPNQNLQMNIKTSADLLNASGYFNVVVE